MKKSFRLVLFLAFLLSIKSFARNNNPTDTSKPTYSILKSGSLDSNILIVVNGNIAGTIRELKLDLETAFHPETIESIHVLKGAEAEKKYGDRGKAGVLEVILKKVTMQEITIRDAAEKDKVPVDDKKIFDRVEVEASFPGGIDAWRKFLEKNLNSMVPMDNNAPMGLYKVVVQFTVDREGNVSDIKALTNHGYGMEAEVIRVIQIQQKWLPAVQNGRTVKAYRKQPVTFMLEGEVEVQTKESYTLYAGTGNPMKIKVDKMKDDEIELSLSNGTITRVSENHYEAIPGKAGSAILTVRDKKKGKEIERIAFTVK